MYQTILNKKTTSNVDIEVIENGYIVVVNEYIPNYGRNNYKKVFHNYEELFKFLESILEIGTAKSGDNQ